MGAAPPARPQPLLKHRLPPTPWVQAHGTREAMVARGGGKEGKGRKGAISAACKASSTENSPGAIRLGRCLLGPRPRAAPPALPARAPRVPWSPELRLAAGLPSSGAGWQPAYEAPQARRAPRNAGRADPKEPGGLKGQE